MDNPGQPRRRDLCYPWHLPILAMAWFTASCLLRKVTWGRVCLFVMPPASTVITLN
jgi:hypothetical protein